MIELSPKALRYARLAAEEHHLESDAARIEEIRRAERDHMSRLREGVQDVARYLPVSDDLARFCLKSFRSVLQKPVLPDGDWDGNDLLFLETVSSYLSRSLSVGDR